MTMETFTLGKETYTLSDECLSRMRLSMDNTVTRERGFPLLGDLQNIMPGKEKHGGGRGITMPEAEGIVGFFHTHPDGDAELSPTDWERIIYESAERHIPFLLCSGAGGEVYCTTVNDVAKVRLPKRWSIEAIEELQEKHLVKPYHFRVY